MYWTLTDRELTFDAKVIGGKGGEPVTATLTTFADAGAEGGAYRIWLRAPGVPVAPNDSLLSDGEESRSRHGNINPKQAFASCAGLQAMAK